MGKKGGGEIEVNEYLMSMHVGLCSEIDELTSIYVGEKQAWAGNQADPAALAISKPSLFGGEKKEGGVRGTVLYLPGRPDQVLPDAMAQKFGRASGADCPGFRGVASLFFTGGSYSGPFAGGLGGISGAKMSGFFPGYSTSGFHWVSNNPYMKDVWVGVKRAPKGLSPNTALIPRLGSSGLVQFTPGATLELKWWQSTYNQGTSADDQARMGVQYVYEHGITLDPDDAGSTDIIWAPLLATAPMVWTERTFTSIVPTGTYAIRVYMEMQKMTGSYNDGYIDDITMTIDGLAQPLTNPGNETHNGSGWTEEVGGLGVRFSNPLPHSGTAYFTGSSNTLTRAYQSFTQLSTGPDANPAHIIYECLTNTDWGMGAASTIIDTASFESAAVTLLFERFGLSLMWTNQTTIEAFVSEILDHIQAMVFVNPRTGLLTLKLIRGDYDLTTLREITPDDAKMPKFQRIAWGEITNEIVVTWTNPENEQEETVQIQDNAAIAAQGGIVSDSRNYYGIRSSALAMAVAARDLRTSSTPLASCEVELDRRAWDVLPGDVIKVTWPEYGLSGVPMRVGPVDYGRPGDPKISVSLIEDIFAYATTDYNTPPTTEWQDDDVVPHPMDNSKIITVPSFFAANYLPTVGTGLADIQYPEVVAGVLASSTNAVAYDIYGQRVAVDGTAYDSSITTNTVAGRALLSTALLRDATTTFVGFSDFTGQVGPAQNVFAFIGGDELGDAECEIALIAEATGNSYTLKRGILDTVPRAWPVGTPVYFIDVSTKVSDLLIRSDAESVTYKLLSRTIGGILSVEAAPDLTSTLNGRPHYPLRPANVKVDGETFTSIDIAGLDPVPVTWSNRNRAMENSQVVYWDEATVTPETGQTTKIRLLTSTGTLITTFTGLTGTSYDIPASSFAGNTNCFIRVSSERDGLESLQYTDINVYSDGSGGTGETGGTGAGSGGTGDFPRTATWSDFVTVSTTTYSMIGSVTTLSLYAGDTVTANADLTYEVIGTGSRTLSAKWQYAVAGSGIWYDFDAAVTGSLAANIPAKDIFDVGALSFEQELIAIPSNDYDIRLVAIVSAGGVYLDIYGTASVVAAGGIAP